MHSNLKTNNQLKATLILASTSPRRRSLLQQAGREVIVRPPQVSELTIHPNGPETLALTNARLKAQAILPTLAPNEQAIVLGADTVVCLDQKIFGKPKDRAQAEDMLTHLSGCWHEVITGVCLVGHATVPNIEFSETTRVLFHPLSLIEIRSYLDTIYPYDKAGAYAAQEGGERIIAQVIGSFSNIVGLPIETLQKVLKSILA